MQTVVLSHVREGKTEDIGCTDAHTDIGILRLRRNSGGERKERRRKEFTRCFFLHLSSSLTDSLFTSFLFPSETFCMSVSGREGVNDAKQCRDIRVG